MMLARSMPNFERFHLMPLRPAAHLCDLAERLEHAGAAVALGPVGVRRQQPLHVADQLVALPLRLGKLLGRVVEARLPPPPPVSQRGEALQGRSSTHEISMSAHTNGI